MTINRPVIIADARYIEGKPVSRVYHAVTNNCIKDGQEPMRLETDEETAKAFGYKYCGNCRNAEEREMLEEKVAEVVSDNALEEFSDLLPVGFEVRIYYHPPYAKQPKQVWSSRGEG